MHVSGLWDEAGIPRENPQTPSIMAPKPCINQCIFCVIQPHINDTEAVIEPLVHLHALPGFSTGTPSFLLQSINEDPWTQCNSRYFCLILLCSSKELLLCSLIYTPPACSFSAISCVSCFFSLSEAALWNRIPIQKRNRFSVFKSV